MQRREQNRKSAVTSEADNYEEPDQFLSLDFFQFEDSLSEKEVHLGVQPMVSETLRAEQVLFMDNYSQKVAHGFELGEKKERWLAEDSVSVPSSQKEYESFLHSADENDHSLQSAGTPESSQETSPINSGVELPHHDWLISEGNLNEGLGKENDHVVENESEGVDATEEFVDASDGALIPRDAVSVARLDEPGTNTSAEPDFQEIDSADAIAKNLAASSVENRGSIFPDNGGRGETESSQNLAGFDSLAQLSFYLKDIKVHDCEAVSTVLGEEELDKLYGNDVKESSSQLPPLSSGEQASHHFAATSSVYPESYSRKAEQWESVGGSGPILEHVESFLWGELSVEDVVKSCWGDVWSEEIKAPEEDIPPSPRRRNAWKSDEVLSFSEHIALAAEALESARPVKESVQEAKFEAKDGLVLAPVILPARDVPADPISVFGPPLTVLPNSAHREIEPKLGRDANRGIGSSTVSPNRVEISAEEVRRLRLDVGHHESLIPGREVDMEDVGSVFDLKLSSAESGSVSVVNAKSDSSDQTVQSTSPLLPTPKKRPELKYSPGAKSDVSGEGSSLDGDEKRTARIRKALGFHLMARRGEEGDGAAPPCAPIGGHAGFLSCFRGSQNLYDSSDPYNVRNRRWRFLRPPRGKDSNSNEKYSGDPLFFSGNSSVTHSTNSVHSVVQSEGRSVESEPASVNSHDFHASSPGSMEYSREIKNLTMEGFSPRSYPEVVLGKRPEYYDDNRNRLSFDTSSSGQFDDLNLYGDEDAFTVPEVRWEALPSRVLMLGQSLQGKQLDWLQKYGTTSKLVENAQRTLCCLANLSDRPQSLGRSIPLFLELHRILVQAAGYRTLKKTRSGKMEAGSSSPQRAGKEDAQLAAEDTKFDQRGSPEWNDLEEIAKKLEVEIRVWLIKYVLSSLDEEKGNKKGSWKIISPRSKMGLEEKLMLLGSLKGVQDWTKRARKWGSKVLDDQQMESLSLTFGKIDAYVRKLK